MKPNHQSKSRLTIDMPTEDHTYLKMASAKLGMSMREFVLEATQKRIEELEDKWLLEKAEETLKRVDSGEEEVVPWNKAKRELSE